MCCQLGACAQVEALCRDGVAHHDCAILSQMQHHMAELWHSHAPRAPRAPRTLTNHLTHAHPAYRPALHNLNELLHVIGLQGQEGSRQDLQQ